MKQYLVNFVTKKGGEENHEMLIMAENAKHAVEVAKEVWYSENTMHAFRMHAVLCNDIPDTEEPVEEKPENVSEQPENVKVYNSYEEYEKTHEDCQLKMNEVAVVYDNEYVCIDAIFDCKRVSTALRRLFKNIDTKAIPELYGWYESISEATENGYMSGFDTSCGDYHGWYGYYAWRVECNEDYIYISLKVRRETETEETVSEQPENVPEHETPETTTVSEECKHCCDCVYYEKCAVNAPHRMECKSTHQLMCGSPVCCEDFISRKSIDDIYEEQLEDEPETASECRLCKKCLHYGENGCRIECNEYECKFGLHGVPCCLGFQTIDSEFSEDPFYRECGIYVGDEPLPEPKPNPNLEPLPEPQHSSEFYCHQKSESYALTKSS